MEKIYMKRTNLGLIKNSIKSLAIFTALVVSAMAPIAAHAGQHNLVGTIHRLDTNDPDINTTGIGGSKLRLANTNLSAGGCLRDNGGSGYVVIWVRDNSMGERMFTTLLAAQLSGHEVAVIVDDSKKNSAGVCYAQQVRITL
jgi:hypothetical protein